MTTDSDDAVGLALAKLEHDRLREEIIRLQLRVDELEAASIDRDAWQDTALELVARDMRARERAENGGCRCCICRGLEGAMLLPRELASDPRIRNTLELYGDFCHAE